VKADYQYDGFGGLIISAGPESPEIHHQFSSKYFDIEIGASQFSFRYYLPNAGKWARNDPIEELGGSNLSAFIDNSAVNTIDYLGLKKMFLTDPASPYAAMKESIHAYFAKKKTTLGKLMAYDLMEGNMVRHLWSITYFKDDLPADHRFQIAVSERRDVVTLHVVPGHAHIGSDSMEEALHAYEMGRWPGKAKESPMELHAETMDLLLKAGSQFISAEKALTTWMVTEGTPVAAIERSIGGRWKNGWEILMAPITDRRIQAADRANKDAAAVWVSRHTALTVDCPTIRDYLNGLMGKLSCMKLLSCDPADTATTIGTGRPILPSSLDVEFAE